MNPPKEKKSFRLSPDAARFVKEAKMTTDAPAEHAGRRALDPVPDEVGQAAGRRSVDTHVAAPAVHDSAQQHSTAQCSTTEPEPAKLPWEDLSRGNPAINFRASPELYAMMVWCKENVPGGTSFLEILREGANLHCQQLIAKHYKPEE